MSAIVNGPRFPLGKVVTTSGALGALKDAK
jgi:hypothetical protein